MDYDKRRQTDLADKSLKPKQRMLRSSTIAMSRKSTRTAKSRKKNGSVFSKSKAEPEKP